MYRSAHGRGELGRVVVRPLWSRWLVTGVVGLTLWGTALCAVRGSLTTTIRVESFPRPGVPLAYSVTTNGILGGPCPSRSTGSLESWNAHAGVVGGELVLTAPTGQSQHLLPARGCDMRLDPDELASEANDLEAWLTGLQIAPFERTYGSRIPGVVDGLPVLALAALVLAAMRLARVEIERTDGLLAITRALGPLRRTTKVMLAEVSALTVHTRGFGRVLVASRAELVLEGNRRLPVVPMHLPGVWNAVRQRDAVQALLDESATNVARWIRWVDEVGQVDLHVKRRYATSCDITIRRSATGYEVLFCDHGDGAGPADRWMTTLDREHLVDLLRPYEDDPVTCRAPGRST
jgi:hypothetical protein